MYVSAVGSKKHFKILKEQDWYFFELLQLHTKYFLEYGVLSFMYMLLSFQAGGTELEIFLPKNQLTQRK